jgi:sugar O-acyltransferase (sialic acid O-acetyltransferase NeuD family)
MKSVSADICAVTVSQLGVNDDVAVVVQWYVADGGRVAAGQNICALETAKALYDISAEVSGYIVHLVNAGDEAKIGQPIALIGSNLESLRAEEKQYISMSQKEADSQNTLEKPLGVTRKAEAAAQRLGINLLGMRTEGIIREQDVIRYYEQSVADSRKIKPSQLTWDVSKKPLIIYGAGQGAVTLKECLEFNDIYQVVCFVDDSPAHPDSLCSLPVFHSSNLSRLAERNVLSLCCEIAASSVRLRVFKQCKSLKIELINVIHPQAYISPTVTIGKGNYIKAAAVIETNTILGNCCIIDNGAVIAHDNIIADGCHIAPGAAMGSNVRIGKNTIVGTGASIATGVKIGQSVIISVGSSVVKNISDYSVVEGVPGKVIGKRKPSGRWDTEKNQLL